MGALRRRSDAGVIGEDVGKLAELGLVVDAARGRTWPLPS